MKWGWGPRLLWKKAIGHGHMFSSFFPVWAQVYRLVKEVRTFTSWLIRIWSREFCSRRRQVVVLWRVYYFQLRRSCGNLNQIPVAGTLQNESSAVELRHFRSSVKEGGCRRTAEILSIWENADEQSMVDVGNESLFWSTSKGEGWDDGYLESCSKLCTVIGVPVRGKD